MAERINFKTSSEKTGELITGFYYRHPISSADVNSLQKNIINNIAGQNVAINTNDNHLEPYINLITDPIQYPFDEDLSTKFKRKVYSLTGSVYNPFTKSYFTISSDNADLQYILPPLNLNVSNRLYFYYRPVTYICSMSHTASVYEPVEGEIVSEHIPAGGFIYTNSVEGSQQYVENDIFDNDMDMEVSVRYGVEWALSWENQDNILRSQGFIPTQTYVASFINNLPNRIKNWVFSNIVSENPVKWKTLPSYIVPQVRAVLFHPKDNQSNKDIWIVEGLPENTNEQYIHAINIVFESNLGFGSTTYTFADSVFYDSTIGIQIQFDIRDLEFKPLTNFRILPNQTLTFTKDRNTYSLIDNSTEAYKKVRYRGFTSNGHIDTSKLNEAWIKYKFNYDTGKFEIPDRVIYNFSGVDHYYDAESKTWKTVIPAGVIRASVAQSKIFEYNEQTGTITTKNNEHRVPPGFLPCDPQNHDFSRNLCSELFKVIGNTYGSDDNDGIHYNPPEFGEVFLRGEKPTTSLSETVKGSDKYNLSITIEKNNLPTEEYNLIKTPPGDSSPFTTSKTLTATVTKGGSITVDSSKIKITEKSKHYHYSGASSSTYPNQGGVKEGYSGIITNNKSLKDFAVSQEVDISGGRTATGLLPPNMPNPRTCSVWSSDKISVVTETASGNPTVIGNNPVPCLGITSCSIVGNNGKDLSLQAENFDNAITYTPPSTVTLNPQSHAHNLSDTFKKLLSSFKLNTSGIQKEISRNIGTVPRYMGVYYYICMGQSLVVDWYNKE